MPDSAQGARGVSSNGSVLEGLEEGFERPGILEASEDFDGFGTSVPEVSNSIAQKIDDLVAGERGERLDGVVSDARVLIGEKRSHEPGRGHRAVTPHGVHGAGSDGRIGVSGALLEALDLRGGLKGQQNHESHIEIWHLVAKT
jgi:hypothetical protein